MAASAPSPDYEERYQQLQALIAQDAPQRRPRETPHLPEPSLEEQVEALKAELPFIKKRLRYLDEHGKFNNPTFVPRRIHALKAALASLETYCHSQANTDQ